VRSATETESQVSDGPSRKLSSSKEKKNNTKDKIKPALQKLRTRSITKDFFFFCKTVKEFAKNVKQVSHKGDNFALNTEDKQKTKAEG